MTSPSAPIAKLLWRGAGVFTPDPDHTAVGVEVADSWLVEDGRARGLDRHRERFSAGCPDPGRARDFFDQALRIVPRNGRWFPRVEWDSGAFRLWVRPAPPASSTVSLWIPGRPDPRERPLTKGPDLATLTALRAEGAEFGADEAVLLAPDGRVREGALSALIWWREDLLCTAPDGPDLLPSVTRALVLALARRQGQPVRFERVRPEQLIDLECWSMSALHGIRAVTGWALSGWAVTGWAVTAHRAAPWQARLLGLAQPLPAP